MHTLPPIKSRPLWVFGYGSLIWNPDFPVAERYLARLRGYRRSFCMSSIHHRGTEEAPGLVLALDPAQNAFCDGVAFRVSPGQEEATVEALRERELISSAYLERQLEISLPDAATVTALTYVVDTAHGQYCGALSLEEQARIIAHAVGGRGPNDEYLVNTAGHLHDLGIADADLDWLVARVRHLKAQAAG